MDEIKKDYNTSGVNPVEPITNPAPPIPEMSKRSRLNKHLERKGKKTLAISILALILIALILFRFGIPFIANLGFLSSQVVSPKQNSDSKNSSDKPFLASPTLNETFSATNSAKVKISGSSTTGKQIAIYLNGSVLKKMDLKNGNFETTITLSDGDNIIKAKSVDGENLSDFSDSITITYSSTPPSLSVDNPHDGDTIKSSPVAISGKTDADTKVTVNGFWAIVDSSGSYSYSLNLPNGDNNVVVVAVDSAGNKTEKTIKVTYSP